MIVKILRLFQLCLYALPLWLMLRGGWLMLRRPRRPIRVLREIVLGAFMIFMAGILSMALQGAWDAPDAMLRAAAERLRTGEKIHLTPFHTIGPQLKSLPQQESLTQLLGNVFLFSPWGFFLPLLWRRFRNPLCMVGVALLLTCFIECTQLFIDRYFEVDDIMLNFLGSMLGSGGWWLLHRFIPVSDSLLEN